MNVRPLLLLATLALGPTLTVAAEVKAPAQKPAPTAPVGKPKPYPLDVCIVTDNDLGSMGEETSIIYEGQTIKFCCAPCEAKFLKNPAKYLAKLAPDAPKPDAKK